MEVLIDSNASSFCRGIIDINKNLGRYNFRKIYDSSSNLSMEKYY